MSLIVSDLTTQQEAILKNIDQTTALFLVEGVLDRLFDTLKELDHKPKEEKQKPEWFNTLSELFALSSTTSEGFLHAKAVTLAIMEKNWDQVDPEIRRQFISFEVYARTFAGDKDYSTIRGWIRTANVWFLPDCPPVPNHTISILDREADGRPVKDKITGEYKKKEVEFNPALVPMSKLLYLNNRAAAGEMTDELWELVIDPHVSCSNLQKTLHVDYGDPVPEIYFVPDGPIVFAKEGEDEVIIVGEEGLNWEDYYNPFINENALVKRAMREFFTRLGMKFDEQKIVDITKNSTKVE